MMIFPICFPFANRCSTYFYFTFVYRLYHLGRRGKKETFVCCILDCLGGGMLHRDSVSLTPLIQVFQGRPPALRPLNLVLYTCTLSWVLDW